MKTIKECIKAPEIKLKDFNEKVNEVFTNLFRDIRSCQKGSFTIKNEYESLFYTFSEQYFFTTQRKCYITSIKPYNLYNYLHKTKNRFNYTDDSYTNAMKYELMMMIFAYGYLDECQVKLSFANVLLKLYRYIEQRFDDSYWFSFEINTIENIYNNIMNTDINDLLKEFQDVIVNKDDITAKLNKPIIEDNYIPTKPEKPEHLTGLYQDGMSQRQWVKNIAAYWLCSEKTATRYLKKFNLWNNTPKMNNDEPDETPDYEKQIEMLQNHIKLLEAELKEKETIINDLKNKTVHISFEQPDSDVIIPTLTTKNLKL